MGHSKKRPGACDMNDVLFLLLGLGGIAAMFGYAVFCNRN